MDRKTQLRRAAFARRRLTTPLERMNAGVQLSELLLRTLESGASSLDAISAPSPVDHPTVAAFVSMGTEMDTSPLLRKLVQRGYRVLVPRLGNGRDIGWSALRLFDMAQDTEHVCKAPVSNETNNADPKADMHIGNGTAVQGHRPWEPYDAPVLPPSALAAAGMIILPALAVDRHGNRLGRGAGWYDRALAYRNPHTLLIAMCWPWEISSETIPHEAHDVAIDMVLTSEGITVLKPGKAKGMNRDSGQLKA